jgi:predicted dienelactone hydrolase
MKRRIAARIVGAALAILMLAGVPVLAAGFEQLTVPDPEGPPLEAGIWYPSQAPASSQPLGLYRQTVATGGQIAGRGLPLVVISHSTGGSFADHYDTALALAEAGFVVAAVTHTGLIFGTGVGSPGSRIDRAISRFWSTTCWRHGRTAI